MSNQAPVADGRNDPPRGGWFSSGLIYFAGLMMMLVGSLNAISGFIALFEEDRYVVAPSGLVIHMDYAIYGVIFLALGIIMVLAGWGLMFRRTWARVTTVVVVFVNAILNWLFLPAYPAWYAILIALDVLIIWAVVARGDKGGWEEFE